MPYISSFYKSIWWPTRSKAFFKSTNTTPIIWPLSKACSQKSIMCIRAVSHEYTALKPDLVFYVVIYTMKEVRETVMNMLLKVRKRAKIKNRHNQAPHLTLDTNGKVTTSQWDITNESQKVSPYPAGDHTRHQQTEVHESITKQDINNINDPQKKHRLGTVSKNILLEGLNRFNGAPTSPKYFWQNRQNSNRSIFVKFFRGTTCVEGSYFCFLPFILENRNIYTVITNEGYIFSYMRGSQL